MGDTDAQLPGAGHQARRVRTHVRRNVAALVKPPPDQAGRPSRAMTGDQDRTVLANAGIAAECGCGAAGAAEAAGAAHLAAGLQHYA
jgi:hypothetical protein